jgi:xanthine dehydrogenase accessory factor
VSDTLVFEALLAAKRSGRGGVLATIIQDRGSVPRHAGSKMFIYPDGSIIGTIGGGEMESRVIAASADVLASGISTIIHHELIDPARGDPGVCGGQVDIFMEPILPEPTVLVIGCGHCGQALADLAHWAGFRVIVSDDRADLCNPDIIPHADEYLTVPAAEIAKTAPIHSRTYIASVTRGMALDVAMLPTLLESAAPYIGVMGSRRRWATAVKKLKEQGISEDKLNRIHAPIGIELNAETPREIAVSILAEIIAHHRGGSGQAMKWMGSLEETEDSSRPA